MCCDAMYSNIKVGRLREMAFSWFRRSVTFVND